MNKLRKVFNKDGSIRKLVYPDGSRRYWWGTGETDYGFYRGQTIGKWNNRHAMLRLPTESDLADFRALLQEETRRHFDAFGRFAEAETTVITQSGMVNVQLPAGVPAYPVGSPLSVDERGQFVVWSLRDRRTIIGTVMNSSGGQAVIQLDNRTAQVVTETLEHRNISRIRVLP